MTYLKFSLGIFLALAASRFIPHPPNFTSLLALSFYIPALLGACIFFLITNFGVWSMGSYGYTMAGFVLCYTLALPFFAYSVISTFIFAGVIEGIIKLKFLKIRTQ